MLLGWELREGWDLCLQPTWAPASVGWTNWARREAPFLLDTRGVRSPHCWGFVFFLLFLAGEAGGVGCKPCPWNLPSQLEPKMSKTPDRERRRRDGEKQGREPLQPCLWEAEIQGEGKAENPKMLQAFLL